ncbi:DNA pilot protein [Apis mellifera associated microvirus 40]|nr:DNA pilot protein [Apis mellifera associated microvirus 40]
MRATRRPQRSTPRHRQRRPQSAWSPRPLLESEVQMIWPVIGAIAGAAITSKTSKDLAEDARNYNAQSSAYDKAYNLMLSDREYERQKEFATMGIRWKTEDAKMSGLHPLAVLGGAGGSGYSPTIVAASTPAAQPGSVPDYSSVGAAAGDYLSRMGQDTTRAQVATATPQERKVAAAVTALDLERRQLENGLLQMQMTEIAHRMNLSGNAQIGPPMPSTTGGHPPVGAVEVRPSEQISASPRSTGLEAASTPLTKDYRIDRGLGIRLPSQGAAEALEGLGVAQHLAGPFLLGLQAGRELLYGPNPPEDKLPSGYEWEWSPFRQSWRAVRRSGRSGGAHLSDIAAP